MEIIEKKISELKAYKNNPRNNDEAVKYVANSIKEFGFRVSIVIDKEGTIVCGHTRLKAAKALKLGKVPCVVADDLSPEQIKAFRLADNKVGEIAEWDIAGLNMELGGLDFDMESFGFSTMTENHDVIEPEQKALKPYRRVHYLVTVDIDDHDQIVDVVESLRQMRGVEVESSLN